ncbi:hypothetical protein GBAR_LOCUS6050 [Geodia barretti]|uniref:Uncharacterized protein n=2 Tax=Geodia barretti TaxID=519541 RepID=A0AA35RCF0_GEOBA|nr:hypothetical protein GBAR_LOCUS6050 [Geodia barretti]
MCDFNLVAVPVHRNLQQESSHPLRRPSFLPLSLPPHITDSWREEGAICVTDRTRMLLLAVASSNGFLPDCPSVRPDPTSILSPQYTDPPDQAAPSFLVHHTGTAFIQLSLPGGSQQHVNSPTLSVHSRSSTSSSSVWRGLHGQLLHPQGRGATSTPLQRSPAKNTSQGSVDSSGEANSTLSDVESSPHKTTDDGDGAASKTGFYWHKNCLLPKQKNVPAGLVGRYDEVLQKLTSDCRNTDRMLETLCERLFT